MRFVFCYYALVGYFRVEPFDNVVVRGRPSDALADAHVAAEAGAWSVPARTAYRLGPGADAPWVCSQVEAIVATIVSNAEGWARSRLRSPGVCQPARTCGESSIPPL